MEHNPSKVRIRQVQMNISGLIVPKAWEIKSSPPVMLSEALQRNAKHEARLSNISE
jgi:hypothetical protein